MWEGLTQPGQRRGTFPEKVMTVRDLKIVRSDQWGGGRCTRLRRQQVQRPVGEKLVHWGPPVASTVSVYPVMGREKSREQRGE